MKEIKKQYIACFLIAMMFAVMIKPTSLIAACKCPPDCTSQQEAVNSANIALAVAESRVTDARDAWNDAIAKQYEKMRNMALKQQTYDATKKAFDLANVMASAAIAALAVAIATGNIAAIDKLEKAVVTTGAALWIASDRLKAAGAELQSARDEYDAAVLNVCAKANAYQQAVKVAEEAQDDLNEANLMLMCCVNCSC